MKKLGIFMGLNCKIKEIKQK